VSDELEQTTKKATTCCFCGREYSCLEYLKIHSATCVKHPLWREVQSLRDVIEAKNEPRQNYGVSSDGDWDAD